MVWALLTGGSPRVRIANRTLARADSVAREIGTAVEATDRVEVEPTGGAAPAGGLCVNCTSLGLGEGDPLPLANGNADAFPFIDEEIKNDKAIYPSEETMKGLFTMKVMPPKVSRVRNRVWTKIKTGQ